MRYAHIRKYYWIFTAWGRQDYKWLQPVRWPGFVSQNTWIKCPRQMKSNQCYAPLVSTISILTLSRPGFFWFSGVGGGRNLPAANISKTIRCMPMKFSQVDGLVKLEYTLQFCCHGNKLWRHYDVIGQKKQFKKVFFQDYFSLFC